MTINDVSIALLAFASICNSYGIYTLRETVREVRNLSEKREYETRMVTSFFVTGDGYCGSMRTTDRFMDFAVTEDSKTFDIEGLKVEGSALPCTNSALHGNGE